MDNVEAAIGKDHLLPVGTGIIQCLQQLLDTQYSATAALRLLHGTTQLRRTDRRRAKLADHNTRRQVGQRDGQGQILARRQRRRQGRDHGIARAGHIKHFARPRGQVQCTLTLAQQRHALFAAGDQQRAQVQLLNQRQALVD